ISIVARKNDISISGGEHISSLEVESALYDHPSVQEVAIVAKKHDQWGETPLAIIVKRENHSHIQANDIIEFTRSQIAIFKAPKEVAFVDALSKNGSRKVLKNHLRNNFNAG